MRINLVSTSAKPKNQLFQDTTVRVVAKEFPTELATLAKLDDKQFDKAMIVGHRQFGTAVRNIIRQTRDPIARNPEELDDIYPAVLKRAIALKLYNESDFNADDLAALTGAKPKPMDLRLFKTSAEYKAFIPRLLKMLEKTFGEGIVVELPKLNSKTRVKQNIGTHNYNSLVLLFPKHIKQMHLTDNDTYHTDRLGVVFSQGAVYLTGLTGGRDNIPVKKKTQEINLVKGTASEVLAAIQKSIKIKTTKLTKPAAVGEFDESAQRFVTEFGRDIRAKGIDIVPGKGKSVIFFHPKRGTVTLKISEDKRGRLVSERKQKMTFGETFTVRDLLTKTSWPKLLKTLIS